MAKKDVISEEMDKRLLDKKLLGGQMTTDRLTDYLDSLPDAVENTEEVVIVMEERKPVAKRASDAD